MSLIDMLFKDECKGCLHMEFEIVRLEDEIRDLRRALSRDEKSSRIYDLETALKDIDRLRHRAKHGERIAEKLKRPCMVLYG